MYTHTNCKIGHAHVDNLIHIHNRMHKYTIYMSRHAQVLSMFSEQLESIGTNNTDMNTYLIPLSGHDRCAPHCAVPISQWLSSGLSLFVIWAGSSH